MGVCATDARTQLVIAGYLPGYAVFLITGGRAGDLCGLSTTASIFVGCVFYFSRARLNGIEGWGYFFCNFRHGIN
jgi:hypothetical protein